MKKYLLNIILLIFFISFIQGCSNTTRPIEEIISSLKGVPTFSIVLDKTKEDGNFFKSYYHKYKIITEEKTTETDWKEVSKDYYNKYNLFKGMTVWVKKEGKESSSANPPGYEYVGDSKYGQWKKDQSGNSFWEFYGKYRMFSDFIGGIVNRNSYDNYYRNHGNQNNQAPAPENSTQQQQQQKKPNFYERKMESMQKSKSSFSEKVNERKGRSSNSYRGKIKSSGK